MILLNFLNLSSQHIDVIYVIHEYTLLIIIVVSSTFTRVFNEIQNMVLFKALGGKLLNEFLFLLNEITVCHLELSLSNLSCSNFWVCWVWLDLFVAEISSHLFWDLFENFLGKFVEITFEVIERNKLNNVSWSSSVKFLGKQWFFISIKLLHSIEISISNTNDNDWNWLVGCFNDLINSFL